MLSKQQEHEKRTWQISKQNSDGHVKEEKLTAFLEES